MKIVHISDGWEKWNGAANIARMIAGEQSAAGHEIYFRRFVKISELCSADEVWIHCGWKPCLWWAAFWAKKAYWMPEACYDPVRLNFHGWKKRLVGPIERWSLRRCKKLVATCEAERKWIQAYVGKGCPEVVVEDIKRFFDLKKKGERRKEKGGGLHLLYLGRRHPLKGVEFLEQAVAELSGEAVSRPLREEEGSSLVRSGQETASPLTASPLTASPLIDLRVVSDHFGEELEKDWTWCDVLCLPTLSDNFGLVIAEALERGKYVITTDGAPAWDPDAHSSTPTPNNYTYIRGYRDGTDVERVRLLKEAIATLGRGVPANATVE